MIAEEAGALSATWYGPGFYGNKTASGEVYTGQELTAAHPDPNMLGKWLVVEGPDDKVPVKVNDTCACELDLSEAAAEKTGVKDAGRAEVTATPLGPQDDTSEATSKEKPSEEIETLPDTGGIS